MHASDVMPYVWSTNDADIKFNFYFQPEITCRMSLASLIAN